MKRTLAYVCVLLSFTTPVRSHTGGTIELTCPLDETEFESFSTMSMTIFGRYTDFMRYGAIGSYYADLIHACPVCKYAGYEDDFSDTVTFTHNERSEIFALLSQYRNDSLDDAEECEVAARIYELRKAKDISIAYIYLVGSYLLKKDPLRVDRRKSFQRSAALYFDKAFAVMGLDTESFVANRYLIAELYRRAGDFDKSIKHFETAVKETASFVKQNPMASGFEKMVLEQQALALKRDERAYDEDNSPFGDD